MWQSQVHRDDTRSKFAAGSMKAEDLTSEVWDYIFLAGPQPQHSAIPAQTLQALRREFEFWYPFDLRVGPLSVELRKERYCRLRLHTALA